MGLFLETAILPGCAEEQVRTALAALEGQDGLGQLKAAECQIKAQNGGVSVLFNEYCAGYEPFARALSAQLGRLVLYLYIYDEDFWGYFCCENGEFLDEFNPMPDYFEDVSEAERQRVAGSSQLIAERFQVPAAEIERYLTSWSGGVLDADELPKAYDGDEFTLGDCWQMADFMARLGYPYTWE